MFLFALSPSDSKSGQRLATDDWRLLLYNARMDINDYLIDQSGKDWKAMLRDWMPPLPESFTLWLVNRFGDVFVVDDDGDGSVCRLEVGHGTFDRVAKNREDFGKLADVGTNAERWFRVSFVDHCRSSGLTLAANQCYGFKVPPMLGGIYEIGNIEPLDIAIHYFLLAQIYKKTKDVKAGATTESVSVKK